MVTVLFVCMGNICRSPMAEGVFRAAAEARGLKTGPDGALLIDSAGTTGYHAGQSPDPRAVAAARQAGFDIAAQRSRKVTDDDFETFDYIVCMDNDNLSLLKERADDRHHGKISLFLTHDPSLPLSEMPDPYYGRDSDFVRCLDFARRAAEGLLDSITDKHFPRHR